MHLYLCLLRIICLSVWDMCHASPAVRMPFCQMRECTFRICNQPTSACSELLRMNSFAFAPNFVRIGRTMPAQAEGTAESPQCCDGYPDRNQHAAHIGAERMRPVCECAREPATSHCD